MLGSTDLLGVAAIITACSAPIAAILAFINDRAARRNRRERKVEHKDLMDQVQDVKDAVNGGGEPGRSG